MEKSFLGRVLEPDQEPGVLQKSCLWPDPSASQLDTSFAVISALKTQEQPQGSEHSSDGGNFPPLEVGMGLSWVFKERKD